MKNCKWLSLFLCIALLFCFSVSASAGGEESTMTVGTVGGFPGSAVTVPVSVSGNPGFNTYSLTLSYDSSRLLFLGATAAAAFAGQMEVGERIVWFSGADTCSNGTFLLLQFQVLPEAAEGAAAVSVSYQAGDICNLNEDDILFTVVPGAVTVKEVLPGDLNGNGRLDSNDYQILRSHILNGDRPSDFVLQSADFNRNGDIDSFDLATLIEKLLNG